MAIVVLLVLAASIWLMREWRTGALAPAENVVGRRSAATPPGRARVLPTAAALNVDASVVAQAESKG